MENDKQPITPKERELNNQPDNLAQPVSRSKFNPKILIIILATLLAGGVVYLAYCYSSVTKNNQATPTTSDQKQESKPAKQEKATLVGQSTEVKDAPQPLGLGFNNAEQVVSTSDDQTFLVFITNNSLEIAKRDVDGNIIKRTKLASGKISLPALTSNDSLVVVAWTEKQGANNLVKAVVSKDKGASFSSVQEIGSGTGASLTSDGSTAEVVWHEGDEGKPSKIMYRQYADSGWLPSVRVDASNKSPLWASIASEEEEVFVTWRDNRNGPYAIWLRRSTDGGKTWQAEQSLTTEMSGDPDICLLDQNNVVIAHHGKTKISLLISQNNGVDFKGLAGVGSGYFAHLGCTNSKIGLAWESTTQSARQSNKKVGWAVYKSDGSKIGGGEINDGSSAAPTIFTKSNKAELLWLKTSTEPLSGILKHQFIEIK